METYGRARKATDENIMWRMRFACCIMDATDTHSAYVILIAFPWQQWLRDRTSMLRYTYIACLVITEKVSVYWAVGTESLNIIPFNFRSISVLIPCLS